MRTPLRNLLILGVAFASALLVGISPATSGGPSVPNQCHNKNWTWGGSPGDDFWQDYLDNLQYDKDVASAGEGNDTLDSQGKVDDVCGHQDNDLIDLGLGTDWGNGGDHSDQVYGGDDNDEIHGGQNGDDLFGDTGGDRNVFGEKGPDEIYGGGGNDDLSGNEQNDVIEGGGGPDDIARGGGGTDSCDAETEYTCE